MEQDTYNFTHPTLGCFAIFIVPIGLGDAQHCYYEAIFNRPAGLELAPMENRLRDRELRVPATI